MQAVDSGSGNSVAKRDKLRESATNILGLTFAEGEYMPIYPQVLDNTPEHGLPDGVMELTQHSDSRNMKRLIDLYAVTPAEARVALLMASGLSTQDVACKLDIGITTVRTHLNRLFSKTDTHHQGQLVALLLAGPPRLEVAFADAVIDDDHEFWVGRQARVA